MDESQHRTDETPNCLDLLSSIETENYGDTIDNCAVVR